MPRRKKDALKQYTAVYKCERTVKITAKNEADAMELATATAKIGFTEEFAVLEYHLIDESRTSVLGSSNKDTGGGTDATVLPGSEDQPR